MAKTVNSEVFSPVNSEAFSPGNTEKPGMRTVNKKEEPESVNKYSLLNKIVNAISKSRSSLVASPPDKPPGVAPGKKKSRVGPKDKTSTEGSEAETEIVQIMSDSMSAHPVTRCDNCRTNPCLDNQFITPKNLVFEKGHSRMERCTKSLSLKAIWGAEP